MSIENFKKVFVDKVNGTGLLIENVWYNITKVSKGIKNVEPQKDYFVKLKDKFVEAIFTLDYLEKNSSKNGANGHKNQNAGETSESSQSSLKTQNFEENDDKAQRIAKMNALSHATTIVRHTSINDSPEKMTEEIIKVSEKLLKWVLA